MPQKEFFISITVAALLIHCNNARMKIMYPEKVRWQKSIPHDVLTQFGKNNRARLRSTLSKMEGSTIRYSIEPLSEDFLSWFLPLYEKTISEKTNGVIYNVREKTLGSPKAYSYETLTLFENDIPIGGTIFGARENMLSVAYRVYPHTWQHNDLQANPSLYSEYLINHYGESLGKSLLSHGKDRNPYGLNSEIGLAAFKLAVGCTPFTPKDAEILEVETDSLTQDAFIFAVPTEGDQITDAFLVTSKETEGKYMQATKYPEQVKVTVMYRD